MLRQLDLGRALVAIGALLLFVALFLDWYDAGGTGWEVFETLDLLLAALAVGTVWAALRADDPLPWLLRAGPLVALVIVAVQIVNPPPVLQLATDAIRLEGADDPDTGAWLALAGAALMSAGAVLALARISIVVDLADRRGPVGAPGREAPAAGGPAEPAPAGGAPGAAAPVPGATGSRRSASLLGGEPREEHDFGPGATGPASGHEHDHERRPPAKAGPARFPDEAPTTTAPPAETVAQPAPPAKPGPAAFGDEEVRDVPAVDRRARRDDAPSTTEPDPTQPLRLPPDEA